MLTALLLLLLANSSDLDACKHNVADHCTELCFESGGFDAKGQPICDRVVYDRCVEQGEKVCRERFPGEG